MPLASAIRDPAEALPRERLRSLLLARLRRTVARVLAAQPAGAARLAHAGLTDVRDLRSLDDLPALPFTAKADLRDAYPFGLLAVARERVVRVHASSGSHGKPTVVPYTRGDLEVWGEVMARCLLGAGVRAGMTIHNAYGYGLFTGGLGFHQGAERLGAAVVPASGGLSGRQVDLLRDLGGEALACTPSFALVIAQALEERGGSAEQLRLRVGLFGAEPWGERMRDEIEAALGLTAVNFYGLSELCGPGVAAECVTERKGLHVQEDHFLVEVVDGDGRPLPAGVEGELVFTTLTKEALPLIRYRTGDIGTLIDEPCACGRTFRRLRGLRGRRDDMLIVRGVNLHPSQVEHALGQVPGVSSHYRLIVERVQRRDELRLECEPGGVLGDDGAALRGRLEHRLHEVTGLRFEVAVVERGSLPRSEGKVVRVLDRRPPL